MQITSQTALITGSSRGIGRAIAIKLTQEGVKNIGIHYYARRDEAEKTLAQVKEVGGDGVLIQVDTADPERMKTIVEEGAQKLGGCDIFLQCAVSWLSRFCEHALATEVPLEKWQLGFDSQARAFFVGAPLAAKHMPCRGGTHVFA